MFFTKFFLAAGGLATLSQAHMRLRSPVPYSSPAIVQDPLDPTGANFPCQARAGAEYVGEATPMEKGSTQTMAFTGSVVHGGGSCQVSITYDNPPTPDSVWKVLHSIQGGCPARNEAGNILPDNADLVGVDNYEYTIPADIPSGNATIAWTWVNKVGNREFYMNCAPVSIEGDGGSEDALAALPDMFTANIGGDCTTVGADNKDILYPNPGNSVENNGPDADKVPPTGNCGGGPAARSRRAAKFAA
ncbi:hypothetical protein QBC40DRAFT_10860 [Triangularia verruculosa]|uniref:Uncharacterized protein n=1 Tax=Triangularia verruculosa TaxID=2587418 RepID=A0AAN7ARU7_9PEZI|nr:hypothetical protein QBC40DRAFT_10860 [Triangularia verruculosa]